ncbi:hypothetical protein, partial [Yersinia enterocolitica]
MSYSTAAWGAAADQTFGYLNTGITVNQAWQAGGITLGFGARFNTGTTLYYGAAKATNPVYDGSTYWATMSGGSTGIATSADLTTWTPIPQQLSNVAALGYVGSNTVTASINSVSSQAVVQYSTNKGSSWTSVTMPATGTSSASPLAVIATGNATYPHLLCIGATNNSVTTIYAVVGNLATGASSFKIASQVNTAIGSGAFTSTIPRIIGSYVTVFSYQNGMMNTANAADLSTGWSSYSIGTSSGLINDLAFLPGANLYVMASTTGIYTIPNPGAVGTAGLLTGTLTPTLRSSAGGSISALMLVGSYMVAFGANGYIATSTDGITWTAITPLQNNGAWQAALYDGSKYVVFSDNVNGIIATSPDLKTNFQATYATENAEVAWSIATGGTGTALLPVSGPPDATTGRFTWNSGQTPVIAQVSSPSSGSRNFAIATGGAAYNLLYQTAMSATGYHYYEIRHVAVAGTPNTFTTSLSIDGILLYTGTTAYSYAATSDITSIFLIAFQRNGAFTAIDDIYVTLDDGLNYVGPLGPVNIIVRRPTSDTQAQWTKVGSASSNALTVSQPAMSSQSANYVTSNTPGDKDIYSSTDTIPAGYSVKAVQVEGYFTKASTSTPSVSIG